MAKTTPQRRKRVRLEDVAQRVEISLGTASMALRGSTRVSAETRRRVRDACKALGYRPPRSSAAVAGRRRDETAIGLVLVGSSVDNVVNTYMLHALAAAAHASRFRLAIEAIDNSGQSHEAFMQRLRSFAQPCDGLLLYGQITTALLRQVDAMHPRVAAMGWPAAVDGADHADGRYGGVVIAGNDQAMGRFATRRLIDRGRRRIAFVAEVMPRRSSHAMWLEGYRLALADAGIDFDPGLVRVTGAGRENIDAAARAFLADPPEAWVVADMVAARGLIDCFDAAGKPIGADDMVIWGNPALAQYNGVPPRPMLAIDTDKWVRAALLHLLGDEDLPRGCEVLVPFATYHMAP